jgi:hypothetical protein
MSPSWLRGFVALALLVGLVLLAGCARRTLDISSDPPGALVYLNDEEVGRTPMKYDFTWYSDYDVTLRKDGYETLKTHRKLKAPVYMWPPLDLISELFGVKDRRQWHLTMVPERPGANDAKAMIDRAQDLKGELRSGKYTHPPTTYPTTQKAD